MNVRIDQSWHDPASGRVDKRRAIGYAEPARRFNRLDFAFGDQHIAGLVDFARRIDKSPAAQQDSAHSAPSPSLSDSTNE